MKRKIKKSNLFFRQTIILFGFLQGFWIAIGINPRDIILGYLYPFFQRLGYYAVLVFGLLPMLMLFLGFYLVYKKGRKKGVIAVFFGFIAGIFALVSPILSIFLLFIAWSIGYFAVNRY